MKSRTEPKKSDLKSIMKRMMRGVVDFQIRELQKYQRLFSDLAEVQHPHTLFITCSDSRVVPHLITGTQPGELFIIRNVGNMVPPHDSKEINLGTASALEFGINHLEIRNIIICGHSNCGACRSMSLKEQKESINSFTRKWLEPLHALTNSQDSRNHSGNERERIEKANILLQMQNLLSYPFIAEKVNRQQIRITGWYYKIPTGEVLFYDESEKKFQHIK